MYRELGVDATCTLADLRAAWRRRVSKLHPDQGGSAEDTGRLQELNRRYDAALAFHARFGRLPGAPAAGTLPPASTDSAADSAPDRSWRRADADHDAQGTAGFGALARYFVAVSLIAVLVLGWRLIDRAAAPTDRQGDAAPIVAAGPSTGAPTTDVVASVADTAMAKTIAAGQDKDTVRHILGEPLDMHALRWHYGPSWVDFRCDRVAGWYSSPLRPLGTGTAQLEAPPADTRCD
ncbi:J domain-containing protein [Lysobacter hankyongensis]